MLTQLDLYPAETNSGARILFINFGANEAAHCLQLAAAIRKAGISAEVYPDSVKMKKQMSYANAHHVPFVALVGETEVAEGKVSLKNMETGEQQSLTIDELIAAIK